MMRFCQNFLLFSSLLWLSGCIESYDLKVNEQEKLLVLSGMITNDPGPYTIKLGTTFAYGAFFSNIDPSVDGATVLISDELGNTEALEQKAAGVYETSPTGIQGRIGGTYTLKIVLKNGKNYVSEPETVLPPVALNKLSAALKPTQEVDTEGNELTRNYVQFTINTQDPAAEKNFYRWDFTSTYEIITQPKDFVTYDRNGNAIPATKDCCHQCWIAKKNTVANVLSDKTFNGNFLYNHQVAFLPFTPELFENKHHMEVRQYNISQAAYMFWNTLNQQVSGTGSVQEPAPSNAVSNIKSTGNPNEKVLGFFSAAGVSRKTIFVKPEEFGIKAGHLVFPDDCRAAIGATTNRPSFW